MNRGRGKEEKGTEPTVSELSHKNEDLRKVRIGGVVFMREPLLINGVGQVTYVRKYILALDGIRIQILNHISGSGDMIPIRVDLDQQH